MKTKQLIKNALQLTCCVVAWFCCGTDVRAQTNDVDPVKALQRLRDALSDAKQAEAHAAVEDLSRAAKGALPPIREALGIGDKTLRLHLVKALTGIGNDEATDLLLERFLADPDTSVSQAALNGLENRFIRSPMPPAQAERLLARINEDNIRTAGSIARLLAKAHGLNQDKVAASVVERFTAEINQPVGSNDVRSYHSYISQRAMLLNQFVLAIGNLSPDAVRPQLTEKLRKPISSESQKWLRIALGTSGDSSVGQELLFVVRDEKEDVSPRALALRAYARALGKQAIPVLESYLGDRTLGPDPRTPPMDLVAHDELARLKRAE